VRGAASCLEYGSCLKPIQVKKLPMSPQQQQQQQKKSPHLSEAPGLLQRPWCPEGIRRALRSLVEWDRGKSLQTGMAGPCVS
jgi:hypothetical protein